MLYNYIIILLLSRRFIVRKAAASRPCFGMCRNLAETISKGWGNLHFEGGRNAFAFLSGASSEPTGRSSSFTFLQDKLKCYFN